MWVLELTFLSKTVSLPSVVSLRCCTTKTPFSHYHFFALLTDKKQQGFPGGSGVKPMQEMHVQSWTREDPLENETVTHSSILAWEIPWTEARWSYSPWGRKEEDTT